MLQFDIITIFPKIFDSYFSQTILARAQKKKLIKIKIHDLRKYTKDVHKSIDDRPYGGGPGMILMIEPIYKALKDIKKKKKKRIIMLTPKGKTFSQKDAKRLTKYEQIVLLCGRYEGFDARVEKFVDEKISIGNFVLAGGELPAMVIVETVARQIPGIVGHEHALKEETFSPPCASTYAKASVDKKALGGKEDLDYIEYPQYTRPEDFKGIKVPKVLLSGNHQKIREWRKKHSKKR